MWVYIRLVNHVKLSLKPTQTSRFCQHPRKTKLKTVHFLSTKTREYVNKSKFLLIKNRGMLQWIWYLNTNFYHLLRIKTPNLFIKFDVLAKKPHTHTQEKINKIINLKKKIKKYKEKAIIFVSKSSFQQKFKVVKPATLSGYKNIIRHFNYMHSNRLNLWLSSIRAVECLPSTFCRAGI